MEFQITYILHHCRKLNVSYILLLKSEREIRIWQIEDLLDVIYGRRFKVERRV